MYQKEGDPRRCNINQNYFCYV